MVLTFSLIRSVSCILWTIIVLIQHIAEHTIQYTCWRETSHSSLGYWFKLVLTVQLPACLFIVSLVPRPYHTPWRKTVWQTSNIILGIAPHLCNSNLFVMAWWFSYQLAGNQRNAISISVFYNVYYQDPITRMVIHLGS